MSLAARVVTCLASAAVVIGFVAFAPWAHNYTQAADAKGAVGLNLVWMTHGLHLASQWVTAAEKARAEAALKVAEDTYDSTAAEAFAVLSKLTYCGNLPGIYGTVAMSCSTLDLPGSSSACERGGFEVMPGFVRTLTLQDDGIQDSFFGYVARVQAVSNTSSVKDGVLIVLRGSIDNFENSVRDKQTLIKKGIEGCPSCGVHAGYHESFHAMEDKLDGYMREFNCQPGSGCTIYVTGHNSGAAVAAMYAMELDRRGYKIGPSYLFGPPQIGDATFAKWMTAKFSGLQGPLYQVTYGSDSVPRWPFNPEYKSWGLEVYYGAMTVKHPQVCWSGLQNCGTHKVFHDDLTSKDNCVSPVAPDGNFCGLADWAMECYGGLGFSVVKEIKSLIPPEVRAYALEQPQDQQAVNWHPSSEDGEQDKAVNRTRDPRDYYSQDVLYAVGALEKVTYCQPTYNVRAVVMNSCRAGGGLCGKAGFGVVPNSVVPMTSAFAGTPDAFFFYTALIRRKSAKYAGAPHFLPAEGCVVALRGTYNQVNREMNHMTKLVPLNDTECPGCKVHEGYLAGWKEYDLEGSVIKALKSSGCEADPEKETTDRIILVGHSMGGSMMTLASYFLTKLGFKVQVSWMLQAGRPGNQEFMDYVYGPMLSGTRPVPFWHVSYKNDAVPRWPPSSEGFGRHHFQVYFGGKRGQKEDVTLCTNPEDWSANSTCGDYQYPRKDLTMELLNGPHCNVPYAPGHQMCLPAYQCYWGTDIAR